MKKYEQLYNIIKNMILTNQLKAGQKVPSIRKTAQIYNLSVTTVQNAYFELCADGYIISKEKSGYFVTHIADKAENKQIKSKAKSAKYDLTGGIADSDVFDISLWQRYIKSALRQKERLLSYSQPKGEYDLRCAVSEYIREKRNVTASPDRIIIGAGVQPLLQLLCSLLDKAKSVSFPAKSFVQGIGIFKDYGFDVKIRNKDADIIYVSPSHMTRWGDVMPIKRRLELVEYSNKKGSLVIEDDYENEFLYNVRPTPSLYALGKDNVVYMGSFSAMLIPSIRISFMVLTNELKELFEKEEYRYCQTASKTEQIALCSYIRDGHINSQIRKTRRLYSAKTKKFFDLLKKAFPNNDLSISENTLQIIMKINNDISPDTFEKHSLKILTEKKDSGETVLIMSPAGVNQRDFDFIIDLIRQCLN